MIEGVSQENASSVASFPGGEIKMYRFIERRKNYTQAMKNQGLNGTVTVSFDIEVDGRVSNVRLKKGVNGLLDEDALRVVRSMPKWTPAIENGEAVKSSKSVVVKYGD
jgi:protein TonB